MTALDPLALLLSVLDASAIEHMVVGSVASTHYGPGRATQDIDLLIEADDAAVERLLTDLDRDVFYVPEEAARAALATRGQFNVIHLESPWKFDLMFVTDHPWDRERFARRAIADLGGVDAFLTTAEDIVLAKLLWGSLSDSSRQRDDAAGVLALLGGRIDRAYLDRWAAELGIGADLHRLLA